MNKALLTVVFFLYAVLSFGQSLPSVININEVTRIQKVLSADDMNGRKTFSPEIDKAAAFIASEFKAAGLQMLDGSTGYLQSFEMVKPKFISAAGTLDGKPLDTKSIIVVTATPDVTINDQSGYEIQQIPAGANFFNEAIKCVQSNKNQVVFVDTSFAKNFGRLTGLKRQIFKTPYSTFFILTPQPATRFNVEAHHEISSAALHNVVGVLPGTSKKEEYVIFSGHYDHLGIGKPLEGDSIFNGANDDAAGITAVILLAKYYAAIQNNERTLLFTAFTAEEIGGFGSQYFSRQFNPAKVTAMFNIEMIGTDSKWGKNSAYITGYEKTDLGKIMEKNLVGSGFTFYPDPYPDQQLFYRSDNATLARLGVPAHTISTSKMDSEKFYHTVNDEIETLDLENMTQIIQSIAMSAVSLINGKDTPTRVDTRSLR